MADGSFFTNYVFYISELFKMFDMDLSAWVLSISNTYIYIYIYAGEAQPKTKAVDFEIR